MTRQTPIAIIGAGPYGLAIAAHLRALGIDFRIFGEPMESWREHMPAGMLLKSEGFASDLYDSHRSFTLKRFCEQSGLPYADIGLPVPLETIVAYGLSFQMQFVPRVERRMVTRLSRGPAGFELQLDDGEVLQSQRVIVAVGHRPFSYIPPNIAHLPSELVSHSSDHSDLSQFRGLDVVVIGGGASALELAALLHEAGAQVRLLARQASVSFTSKPAERSLLNRIHYPMSGLGGGWANLFFADAPRLFRYFPRQLRSHVVKTVLGPAGGWFVKERVVGRIPILAGHVIERAALIRGGRLCLSTRGPLGQHHLTTEHIIAATGYAVNLGRLRFICKDVRDAVRTVGNVPELSANFECSVPGLHFIGLASTHWFGPVMRFLFGANYTARRLSLHLARTQSLGAVRLGEFEYAEASEPPRA